MERNTTRIGARWQRRGMWALTLLVFVTTFLYRFNALGGSLRGFDGDHFIYYLGIARVVDGERPLRDFADAGLQGAWPALTYELPALAQRLGGKTLLSEAVFSVGAIALAVACLFRSAAAVAGPLAALVVAALTIGLGTRTYGYSKVLVFSVAVALLLRYARHPTRASAALLAVWSAVAFLFRHDYLVFLAPSVGVLIAMLPQASWRQTRDRLLVYGGLTTLLLIGPLYSIERYVGLEQYLRSNIALVDSESRRTDLHWPAFEPATTGIGASFENETNAAASLYYICLAIPGLALVGLLAGGTVRGLDPLRSRALLVSLALLALLLNRFLLRGNLQARFGDLGAPIAVLAAWLATAQWNTTVAIKIVYRTAVAVVGLIVALSVFTIGGVWRELDTTGLRDSLGKIDRRFRAAAAELRALPPGPFSEPSAMPNTSDYLRACTLPDDRALVLSDSPEVTALAGRAFAAGQPVFRPGFYTLPADQALMLTRLGGQSVPVVLTDGEEDYRDNIGVGFPDVYRHVEATYRFAGELPSLTGPPMRVLVRRDRVPTGAYRETGLPCFAR